MQYVLIMNSWVLICSLIGLIYGARRFFKPKKPIFLQLVTCAVACMMYARLFHVLFVLVQGGLNLGFDIGMLGIAGSLMFIMSANYGQMDSLVDDGTRKFLLTRIIALIAPVIVIGFFVLIFITIEYIEVRVSVAVVTFFMIPCAYYSLKHLIIYDVNLGLIRPLRPYNLLGILYAITIMMELFSMYNGVVPMYLVSMFIQGLITIAMVPVARKGVMRWTI